MGVGHHTTRARSTGTIPSKRRAVNQPGRHLPGPRCCVLRAALAAPELGRNGGLPCLRPQEKAVDPREKGRQKPGHLVSRDRSRQVETGCAVASPAFKEGLA